MWWRINFITKWMLRLWRVPKKFPCEQNGSSVLAHTTHPLPQLRWGYFLVGFFFLAKWDDGAHYQEDLYQRLDDVMSLERTANAYVKVWEPTGLAKWWSPARSPAPEPTGPVLEKWTNLKSHCPKISLDTAVGSSSSSARVVIQNQLRHLACLTSLQNP